MNEAISQGTTVQQSQPSECDPREEPKATDVKTPEADANTVAGGGKDVDGDEL